MTLGRSRTARVTVLALRTSCVWPLLFGGLYVGSIHYFGIESRWPALVLVLFGVCLLGLGAGLLTSRPARHRVQAWNRAYWSRKNRAAPAWCSYGSRFLIGLGMFFLVGGSVLLVQAIWIYLLLRDL